MKKLLISLLLLATVLSLAGFGSMAMLNDSEISTGSTFTAGTWGPQTVTIEIKADDDTNTINPNSNGVIKVAVLTTLDFNATYIDVDRVFFGPMMAVPESWEITDFDNDLDLDMVLTFRTQDTGLRNGDTQAQLIGCTVQNKEFKGVDTVRTVPLCNDE